MPDNFEPQGDINFVTHDEPKTATLVDQIFTWTIAKGRTVVVLTAVVVMLIFIVRQKISNDLNRAIEEIGPNKAIVENNLDQEREYRQIQERVTLIGTIINSQTNWKGRLSWFDTKIPTSVEKQSVKFDKETISFTGRSPSSDGFRNLIVNLITDDDVRNLVIQSSRLISETNGYEFEIQILIEQ